ncbi:MAG: ATP-binding cassette domain-containing protein, partial [Actinobacteria bacterium]|nr:ATP-binding cassette domain-containing protein [Actinomycetota bacterium]
MNDAAIVVEGLGKRFGEVVAIDGINLEVPAGTVLGLLGPNGAGKTTTVRILTTIIAPDAGRATVLGLDVVQRPRAVRSVIGLAGQYAAVDENLTGRENLRMVGQLTHQPGPSIGPRAAELLERFDLVGAADRPVKTYSGGMRRRLDLAAALVHRPRVLFLDEPTTGLDPSGRNDLWTLIGELVADGTTLLLTTQYLEEADRLADRIVVIDGGTIIAEGSAAELKARLGTTVVEVHMASAGDGRRAAGQLAGVGATEVVDAGETVAVTVPDSGPSLLEVVRLLDSGGFEPVSVAVREPTLDDVFMRLTGRGPTSDGGSESEQDRRQPARATAGA